MTSSKQEARVVEGGWGLVEETKKKRETPSVYFCRSPPPLSRRFAFASRSLMRRPVLRLE